MNDVAERTRCGSRADEHHASLLSLPSVLKQKVASFLSSREAGRTSVTCKAMSEDLCMSELSMKIAFKSWYGTGEYTTSENRGRTIRRRYASNRNSSNSIDMNNATAAHESGDERGDFDDARRGPKIPFLRGRTHSVIVTGSWSLNSYNFIRRGEFYIVAHPINKRLRDHRHLPFEGGRVLWASPVENIRRARKWNEEDSWVNVTVTFQPRDDENYYLYVKSGPKQMMLAQSLQVSNLNANVIIYDCPGYAMSKQYKTLVRHMSRVENRGAFYTKMLQAVTRSIRIQLARKDEQQKQSPNSSKNPSKNPSTTTYRSNEWENAVDPFLEKFFQTTRIERDSNTLQILEEIACFLSENAYMSEQQNAAHDKVELASNSTGSVAPDWAPYAGSVSVNSSSVSSVGVDDNEIDEDKQEGTAAVTATTAANGAVVERWLNVMRRQQNSEHNGISNINDNSGAYGTVSHRRSNNNQGQVSHDRRGRRFVRKIVSAISRKKIPKEKKQTRRISETTEAMQSSTSWTVRP